MPGIDAMHILGIGKRTVWCVVVATSGHTPPVLGVLEHNDGRHRVRAGARAARRDAGSGQPLTRAQVS